MLQRLRSRVQGQEGFTLIELLVVILIIGILAAVAIPTFLSQTSKAYDSNVQSSIDSAQTAEATYLTNNGAYTNARGTTNNPLITIESTLSNAFAATTASPPGYGMAVTGASGTAYTINATDPKDGVKYTLAYNNGTVTKTCSLAAGGSAANKGGCQANRHWGGQ